MMSRNGKKMAKHSVRNLIFAEIVEQKFFSTAVVPATTSPRAPGNVRVSTSRDPAVAETNLGTGSMVPIHGG